MLKTPKGIFFISFFLISCLGTRETGRPSENISSEEADVFFNQENYAQAFKKYHNYIKTYKNTNEKDSQEKIRPEIFFKAAYAAFYTGRYQEAANWFKESAASEFSHSSKDLETAYYLLSLLKLSKHEEIKYILSDLSDEKQTDSQLYIKPFLEAEIAYQRNDISNALISYIKFLRNKHYSVNENQSYFQNSRNIAAFKTAYLLTVQGSDTQEAARFFDMIDFSRLSESDLLKTANLYRKAAIKRYSTQDGLPENFVSSLVRDGHDLWVGTWLSGLCRLDTLNDHIRTFQSAKKIPGAFTIRDIISDHGRIWIASFSSLYFFDKKKSLYVPALDKMTQGGLMKTPSEGKFKTLLRYSNRIFYGSLIHGIGFYDPENRQAVALPFPTSQITTLEQCREGFLVGTLRQSWFLTDFDFKEILFSAKKQEKAGRNVRCIASDNQSIYIGTKDNGLYIYNCDLKKTAHYTKQNSSLKVNYISSIHIRTNDKGSSNESRVFIGTMGGGLYTIDNAHPSLYPLTFFNKEGFHNITGFADHPPFLWIGTAGKGLVRYYHNPALMRKIKL